MFTQTLEITPKTFFLSFLLCSWALNPTEQRCGLAMASGMCQLHSQASESNKWLKNPQQAFFPATCSPSQAGFAPARPKPPACPRICPGCTPSREAQPKAKAGAGLRALYALPAQTRTERDQHKAKNYCPERQSWGKPLSRGYTPGHCPGSML